MAAGPTWLMLLALLLGGGGSDLLDFASPDVYWKDRQVQVSVEAMAREFKPPAAVNVAKLIDDLDSADATVRQQAGQKLADAGPAALAPLRQAARSPSPQVATSAKGLIHRIIEADRPASVRRLMAIKALGQLKDKHAITVLEPLLKSDEPFVADYAREAIDQIDGRPVGRTRPADLRDDVWRLPPECRAVGQIVAPPSGPLPIGEAMKGFPLQGQDPAAIQEQVTRMLISAAESIGNVRLDGLSFGVSGEIGDRSGFVVGIARGHFDARAIAQLLHKQKVPANEVGGTEIFQPTGGESALFFTSDHYAVAIAGPRGQNLPVAQVLDALRTRSSKLKEAMEMKKLIDSAAADQPLWAVMKVTPAYAQAPVFAPFGSIKLSSQRTADGLSIDVDARGSDPAKAKTAVDIVNAGSTQAVEQLRRMEQFMPQLKPLADGLATAKCQSSGGNATLTANMPGRQSALIMLPMLGMFQVRAATAPAPQAQPQAVPR